MTTHFIVHDKADTVGVMVVENVPAGENLTGWIMETDETITVKALDPVPLGHKIALKDIQSGDTILKYGHDVGRAVAAIGKGHHVHVHNMKTKRW
jgi:(2R)-sulfolactate sulfo-lyase subunit alpha